MSKTPGIEPTSPFWHPEGVPEATLSGTVPWTPSLPEERRTNPFSRPWLTKCLLKTWRCRSSTAPQGHASPQTTIIR